MIPSLPRPHGLIETTTQSQHLHHSSLSPSSSSSRQSLVGFWALNAALRAGFTVAAAVQEPGTASFWRIADGRNGQERQCPQPELVRTSDTSCCWLAGCSWFFSMACSCCCGLTFNHNQQQYQHQLVSPPIISLLICFLLLVSAPVCADDSNEFDETNQTLRPDEELGKMKLIREHLRQINKPAVKTIQSPDGDIIDCVRTEQQPAFDHPRLMGQQPLAAPEKPTGHDPPEELPQEYQVWRNSGESCPDGTIPIRRTTEGDLLRASSAGRYGRKSTTAVRRDSSSSSHEHAVGYVTGEQYYGAKATINVWAPKVTSRYEFSLSQMWVISGSFSGDLNTIEAGWQVSPELYGDSNPRFFTYWTTDAYRATGCYNLLCSGFVQTSNKIAIGAAISPVSAYRGGQFDINLLIWKDPKHGNWWLEFGSGFLVGYWPAFLFTHLKDHATMVQYGGEIVNSRPNGMHTATQMGSGHFSGEGFGKASYFRNLQVVDWDNSMISVRNLRVLADHPNCYDIRGGVNRVWGNYFYYGGPGRNVRCP